MHFHWQPDVLLCSRRGRRSQTSGGSTQARAGSATPTVRELLLLAYGLRVLSLCSWAMLCTHEGAGPEVKPAGQGLFFDHLHHREV